MNQTYGQDQPYWSTYDLAVSSCLISLNFKIAKIDRSHSNRVCFIFPRTEKLKTIVEDYYADKLLVNPRVFFDSQKLIKNMLYSDI